VCEVDDMKCERVARRRGQYKRVMTGTIAETSFRQTEVGVGESTMRQAIRQHSLISHRADPPLTQE
jgi:hypothetical protein